MTSTNPSADPAPRPKRRTFSPENIDTVMVAISDIAVPGVSLDYDYQGGTVVMETVLALADEVRRAPCPAGASTKAGDNAVHWSDIHGPDELEQLITAKVPAPEALAAGRLAGEHHFRTIAGRSSAGPTLPEPTAHRQCAVRW